MGDPPKWNAAQAARLRCSSGIQCKASATARARPRSAQRSTRLLLPRPAVARTTAPTDSCDTKTGGRAVSLAPSAVRLLESLPRDEGNPWVIAGRKPPETGQPLIDPPQSQQRNAPSDLTGNSVPQLGLGAPCARNRASWNSGGRYSRRGHFPGVQGAPHFTADRELRVPASGRTR